MGKANTIDVSVNAWREFASSAMIEAYLLILYKDSVKNEINYWTFNAFDCLWYAVPHNNSHIIFLENISFSFRTRVDVLSSFLSLFPSFSIHFMPCFMPSFLNVTVSPYAFL